MSDEEVFNIIKNIINSRRNLNNPYDDTYVRRLEFFPEFLTMPYWTNYREYVDFKQYLEEKNFKGNILDFGCGSGHMDILLARDGYDIYGVDLSPMAIDIGNALKECEDDEVKKRVTFSLEDVTEENIKGNKYDLVWASHVMEHIKDAAPIFEGLRKRVVPGSKMRVSVPLGYAFNDPDHVHHWMTKEQFSGYFSRYIKIEEVVIENAKQIIVGYFVF